MAWTNTLMLYWTKFDEVWSKMWNHGWRKTGSFVLGFVLGLPLLTLPLTPLMTRTIFVCFLMAFYWITETLPIAVTSLLPVALFPFMGILESDKVGSAYFNDTIFLFVGSFIVALAMEKWELHRRFALKILTLVGNRPRTLLLAFMLSTGFLSMWMSNTSTAGVMVPLVMTTIKQLKDTSKNKRGDSPSTSKSTKRSVSEKMSLLSDTEEERAVIDSLSNNEESEGYNNGEYVEELNVSTTDRDVENFVEGGDDEFISRYAIAVLLGICYSASIGGTATIIGTGPNLVFKSQMRALFPDAPEISFMEWSLFAFPTALLMLFTIWGAFCFFYIKDHTKIQFDMETFRQQLKEMGPMKFGEIVILIDLGVMVFLWFTRVGFGDEAPGWGALFHHMPGDGTVAILLSAVLFIVPSSKDGRERVMDWEATKELPWGIILLLGAGFALAKGIHQSGLSEWIGEALKVFGGLPRVILVVSIVAIITFTTELTSNVATANICLPILASMATSIGENPLLLMIPGTISTSYAFMLPVATPPNAIVFASGQMQIKDMVIPGFFINVFAIFLLPAWMFICGLEIFDIELGELPSWVKL